MNNYYFNLTCIFRFGRDHAPGNGSTGRGGGGGGGGAKSEGGGNGGGGGGGGGAGGSWKELEWTHSV